MDVHKLTEEFGQDHLRDKCGLPLATYFSATKLSWLLTNVPEVLTAFYCPLCANNYLIMSRSGPPWRRVS